MKRLHIFRAGRRTALSGQTIEFSQADLAASASAYDPALHEAPLVLGHPKLDAPAQGWVSALAANDDDLHATPRAVDAQFAEAVAAERFKKVSAAFYPPDHPRNPVPGVYYLRHVGFLGAMPPAVKGLSPVEFADDGEGLVEIEFGEWSDGHIGRAFRGLREWVIGKFGLEEADKALPGWTADALIQAAAQSTEQTPSAAFAEDAPTSVAQESLTMSPEQIAAAQKKLDDAKKAQDAEFAERESKLKERESAAAEADARTAKADAVVFAETLVEEGRIPPAQQARVVEMVHMARAVDTELTFAEGDTTVKTNLQAALKSFLTALPQFIEYGEVSGTDKGGAPDADNAEQLAQSAVEFVESEKAKGRIISVAQAMDHVTSKAKR